VKVGDPLKGNPFTHCPTFKLELSGRDLIDNIDGCIRQELGGTELFVAAERLSEEVMPRDVSGQLELEPTNGPHGFRSVFLAGRQIDDAKVWTSAMFIKFK
jgi:hypothetical protein